MAKTIKIRAWDPVLKVMVYDFTESVQNHLTEFEPSPEPQYFISADDGSINIGAFDKNGDWYELEIMQSTGKQDNAGTLIWEDDFVSTYSTYCYSKHQYYKVELTKDGWQAGGYKLDSIFYFGAGKDFKVSGNIHENPEM